MQVHYKTTGIRCVIAWNETQLFFNSSKLKLVCEILLNKTFVRGENITTIDDAIKDAKKDLVCKQLKYLNSME